MTKLVYGVGFNDRKYLSAVGGRSFGEYKVWRDLLARCYHPKVQKKTPSYVGCSVSESFKSYSYFYEWCQSQIGFGRENYHLDKDLLLKGNKVYSEAACVFLPRELNVLLTSRKAERGELPIGVSTAANKFRVRCCRKPLPSFVGIFDTPELAFQAYKQAKETYIKLQAEKWKALIDPRAYAALMAYEVLPTD